MLLCGLALVLGAPPAEAFSTRVHIMLANRIRDALAAGGTSIQLWQGGHSVTVSPDDARAILDEPEAFRAGAIGPDNMIFPGMTDPSHALHQRPFEQCQRLYEMAVLDKERAYAIGCFLHGASDAVAHHYVNQMSGETFTLNPISEGRDGGLSNVVRHIVAEDMIQDAVLAQSPSDLSADRLAHEIPTGFVLRSYFDLDSPVYELMAAHAIEAYNQQIENNPGITLPEVIYGLDVAPADQFVLLPVYVEQIHLLRAWLRQSLQGRIAGMQDWNTDAGSQLLVLPGDDGVLGTRDDDTDCSASCAQTFAEYFVYVGLMEPRYDAGGNALPPAFDKVSDKFGADLDDLMPSMMDTVINVSTRFNLPLDQGGQGLEDITVGEVEADFVPLVDWSNQITTVDSQSIAVAISPQWLTDMGVFFQTFGINVDVTAFIEAILEPIIAPIRDGIREFVIGQAIAFIEDLTVEYRANFASTRDEYTVRLQAAMNPALGGGTMLDRFFESGLYGHSFNIVAAAIGNHAAVLPVDGAHEEGVGPASFDCSYTATWMQAGACEYLREVVFPLGEDVRGAMSILTGGQPYPAQLEGDSPIECHDGSLTSFAASPSSANCYITTLQSLETFPQGSISRAFPPAFSDEPAVCTNIIVPGLPGPPDNPTTTGAGGAGAGGGSGDGGDDDGKDDDDDDDDGKDGKNDGAADAAADEGCGCKLAGTTSPTGTPFAAALLIAGAILWRRARRASAVALAATAIVAAGCGDSAAEDDAASGGGRITGAGGDDDDDDDDDDDGDGGRNGDGGASGSPSSTGGGPTSSSSSNASSTTSTGSGGAAAQALLDKLDGTAWNALLRRDGTERERAYELWFDGEQQLWAEVRNPFGPSRKDRRGEFVISSDGSTVTAVDDDSGAVEVWSVVVEDGSPRTLHLERDGVDEVFVEGVWPEPLGGLTAELRTFTADGAVADAYCKSGTFCSIEYGDMFDFARGASSEEETGRDLVAGSQLRSWYNVPNFAVTDVDGFDFQTLGGSELSDQFNFFVRYTGYIDTPGGVFSMRERDDDVGELNPTDYGGVWVFLGDDAGVGGYDDLFLGVNAFGFCSDGSDDEPAAESGAGLVAVEIIMVRCNTDGPAVDVEMAYEGEDWAYVGDQSTVPDTSIELFPAGL